MKSTSPLNEGAELPSIHANEINGLDCPACGHPTLMVMGGGYITCCLSDCPNPDYADALDKKTATADTAACLNELRMIPRTRSKQAYIESRLAELNGKGDYMTEVHIHQYTTVELFRIVKVHKNYQGTAGDRAILYRKCICSKGEAFEYGSFKDMTALYATLT